MKRGLMPHSVGAGRAAAARDFPVRPLAATKTDAERIETMLGVLMLQTQFPMVMPQGPPNLDKPATEAAAAAELEVETVQARPHRISWARLLKRVFSCDVT
jgi:hypothetical protein